MSINIYDSSNIKVLKGLEGVRKRPGMYIGDTSDDSGLHHMIFEIIDNSVDEFLSGFCKNIIITLYKDNSVSILDDGRGIPVDIHKDTGLPAIELIMTVLHSGGKFDNNSYDISGGLHGVGLSVVNALSKKLILKIYKENKIFYQIYSYGKPKSNVSIIGNTDKTGTYIRFWPDKSIFINFYNFKYDILFNKLNELSYLNNGLKITLISLLENKNNIFLNYGGIKSFLSYLINNKNIIHKNIFYFKKKKKNIILEFACRWVDTFKNNILCYTNNIFQCDGGTHLSGLKLSITRTINLYFNKEINNKKKYNYNIIGNDTREGLYAILSIKMNNPKFSSQIKNKLISSEVKFLVESLISDNLFNFFLENPIDAKNIINKILISSKNRELIKKIKNLNKKKNKYDLSFIASKLADCQQKNSKLNEIFLVEGDSAGGSAKQSRNRFNQAVLPLKGKVINVEKTNLNKILFSEEINILISVLGCGIKYKKFNLKKLRYNNIIIMTDADIDGAHIRTLLLAFFYRYMPDLINNGHLYIARPPLYRIKYLNKEYYVSNENSLIKYKIYFYFKNINIYKGNNNILLKNNKLIKLVINYLNFIKLISKKKNKFIIYLLNSLMFFKKLNINNYINYNLWLKNFLIYLNKNIFLKKKIVCKLLKDNKNNFYKFKFIFFDNFIYKYVNIDIFFLKNYYYSLLNLGKKLYFFNKNYKKYILINNKKKYFSNFYNLIKYVIKKKKKYIFIQRYKGLGEMNPDQLWNTTMNPKNRYMSKIYIEDTIKADKLFKVLMGDSIKYRKIFIKKNINYDKKYINL